MRYDLIFVFWCTACLTMAQEPYKKFSCEFHYDSSLKQNVYDRVDEWPVFPGGPSEAATFIIKNIKYFDVDNRKSIYAAVVIDVTGKIIQRRIMNKVKRDYTRNEKEVLKVIKMMPRWKPGSCNGKEVPVQVLLPLH